MSPRAAAEFSRQWPALRRRLEAFLRSKGVRNGELDDLVQETATRLLSVWHKFDRRRPVWPLTATIALNLLRDRSKKRDLELFGELPDVPASFDAAQIGLARIELARVLEAMGDLTPSQRRALLQAVDPSEEMVPSSASEKMLRMRARKRLANAVGRVSAGLTLKLRKTSDAVHALFSKADVVQALACATCLFVTTAGAVSLYPPAQAGGIDSARADIAVSGSTAVEVVHEISADGSRATESLLAPQRSSSADEPFTEESDLRVGRKNADDPAAPSTPEATEAGSLTIPSGTVPANAPVPSPPDAPTSPPDAPTVAPEAPSPDEGSPVQAPTDDAPLQVVDEATEALREVTK